MGSPHLESIFDKIVEVFFYMDKNGDGKLNNKDIVAAFTDAPTERSPSHVTRTRFSTCIFDLFLDLIVLILNLLYLSFLFRLLLILRFVLGHICSGDGQGQGQRRECQFQRVPFRFN